MNKNQWVLLGGGVLVIIFIFFAFLSRGNGSNKNTEKQKEVLQSALAKLVSGSTLHSKSELVLDLPSKTNGNSKASLVNVNMQSEGDLGFKDNSPAYQGTMRIEAKGRGTVLFADGDLVVLPDRVAFRLDNLPTILNPTGSLVDKWTHVNVPTLSVQNSQDVSNAIISLADSMTFSGSEKVPGTSDDAQYYTGTLSADQEAALIHTFEQQRSGSRALNIVARLLKGFDVQSVEAWVAQDDNNSELRYLRILFHQQQDEENMRTATLALSFSDYGKEVSIETPPKDLDVKPEVFQKLFGEGQVNALQAQ